MGRLKRVCRSRAPQPRNVLSSKHRGDTVESWGASETLTGRIKVLQNSDSLSSLAQQHGLNVRWVGHSVYSTSPDLFSPCSIAWV